MSSTRKSSRNNKGISSRDREEDGQARSGLDVSANDGDEEEDQEEENKASPSSLTDQMGQLTNAVNLLLQRNRGDRGHGPRGPRRDLIAGLELGGGSPGGSDDPESSTSSGGSSAPRGRHRRRHRRRRGRRRRQRQATAIWANISGWGSARQWVRMQEWSSARNRKECERMADAVDALVSSGVPLTSEGMEVLLRNFAGVHLADATGNWSVMETTAWRSGAYGILPRDELARALREASRFSSFKRSSHNGGQGGK
jgi:hypothetical protein